MAKEGSIAAQVAKLGFSALDMALDDRATKDENEFAYAEAKPGGASAGYVGQVMSGPNQGRVFMVKDAQNIMAMRGLGGEIIPTGLAQEYISGAFFKRFLYDRAPEIALIQGRDKKTVVLRSKFLDSFQTVREFNAKGGDAQKVEGLAKVFAVSALLGDVDLHAGNVGVVEREGVLYAVKIDHGGGLSRILGNELSTRANLALMLYGDKGSVGFRDYKNYKVNIIEFRSALDQIAQTTDDEIDQLVGNRVHKLQQGFRSLNPDKGSPAADMVTETELVNHFAQRMKHQRGIAKDMVHSIDVLMVIENPEWREGAWFYCAGIKLDDIDIQVLGKKGVLDILQKRFIESPRLARNPVETRCKVYSSIDREIAASCDAQELQSRVRSRGLSAQVVDALIAYDPDKALELLRAGGIPGRDLDIIYCTLPDSPRYGILEHVTLEMYGDESKCKELLKELHKAGVKKDWRYLKGIAQDVVAFEKDPRDALDAAVRCANIPVLQAMLDRPDIDPNTPDKNGDLPFHVMIDVYRRRPECLAAALQCEKININLLDRTGKSALDIAREEGCDEQIISLLESRGAVPSAAMHAAGAASASSSASPAPQPMASSAAPQPASASPSPESVARIAQQDPSIQVAQQQVVADPNLGSAAVARRMSAAHVRQPSPSRQS